MEFVPFFLLLIAIVLFSSIFRKFHLPWVIALILAGVVIGPFGFDLIEVNSTIEFISQIGLISLMFMAGLETRLGSLRSYGKGIAGAALLNGLIPFVVGFGIAYFFNLSLVASLLLGIIFISSSIAVIVPTLEARGVLKTKLGQSIVFMTILEDVASLVLLSILLQSIVPVTSLPLPYFYIIVLFVLVALFYGLRHIRSWFPHKRDEKDLFESEVRVIFVLLLGTVILFEILGLHSVIAGFFSGLVLSDTIKSKILLEKIRTISYGIFIPVFFVIVGVKTDIGIILQGSSEVVLISSIVIGSVLSKFVSGFIGGRFLGFSNVESSEMGFSTIPQLSTSLAVAFAALEFNIISDTIIVAIIILSVVTTIVAPLGMIYFDKKRVA